MKQILLVLSAVSLTAISYSQVAISNPASSPDPSAMLDVKSTSKGFLLPRLANRNTIASPAVGLMVYEIASNSLWVYNGTGWVQLGASSASNWLSNGSGIYNGNTGNVGIGLNTNINKKFTVKGDALFINADGSTSVTMSLMGAASAVGSKINFLSSDSSIAGSIYASPLLDRLYFQQGSNTNQLVLNGSGRVGINNPVPTRELDVIGSIRSRDTITADDDLVAGDNVIAGDNITAGGTINATGVVSGAGFFTAGNILVGGTSVFQGNVQGNSELIINGADATLHLKNSVDDKGFLQVSGDDLRIGTYSSNTTGKFVVRTGGDDQVYVDQNGNMGFDIAAPLTKIHIPGGSDASLSSHGYLMLGPVTGSNIVIDNNEIVARSNGAAGNLVLQNDGGTVRIGSVAVPTGYKFAINGKMICEELKVKLASGGWPDYVFENKYRLRSLSQLEEFIKQNKHLPNIPSAKEVEQNGLEIGDMQKRMMEKIEELTLYVIELKKQLDDLKANK